MLTFGSPLMVIIFNIADLYKNAIYKEYANISVFLNI